MIFAWTDREYGTAFEFRDRDYLSVEHGLDGTLTVLDGPGGETIDGDQFELTSEKTSYEYDLRYLAGEEGTEYPIDIRDHRTPEEDEPVIVIGHPNNVGYWAVSLGRYVETQQSSWRGTPHLIVSAPGTRGNSGGPAFSLDGSFIGMVTHTSPWREVEIAEPDPYFNFAAYQPYVGVLPAATIVEQVEEWV